MSFTYQQRQKYFYVHVCKPKKIHSYNLNSYRYKINTCYFLNLNFTFLIMLFCVVCGFMCLCMHLRRYSVFRELELQPGVRAGIWFLRIQLWENTTSSQYLNHLFIPVSVFLQEYQFNLKVSYQLHVLWQILGKRLVFKN